MYFKSILLLSIFFFSTLFSQNIELGDDAISNQKSLKGAFGAVTIDGKIWNQIALRPIVPFGKLSVAFDLVIYIDQDGNIYDDDWNFSSGNDVKNTLVDKIYYVRYGNKWQKTIFKLVHLIM